MASLIMGESSSGASSPAPTRPKLTRQLTGTSDDADEIMGDTNDVVMDGQSQNDDASKSSSCSSLNGAGYQSHSTAPIKLTFNMGGVKDEGVKGKENQDDYFVWNKGDGKTYVIAVLDGHGRELGKLASKAAKDSIYSDLTTDDVLGQLRATPQETMTEVFRRANDAIRTVSLGSFLFFSLVIYFLTIILTNVNIFLFFFLSNSHVCFVYPSLFTLTKNSLLSHTTRRVT
jgi:hypothetical protein